MELVLGSWHVTWEAAFGIRPSSCWDLCWSCICIYVSFGMRNKCPRSDYSALSFPRWLIEMAEGLIWLQAFSEGFWQHLTAFACYVKLTKAHIFGRSSYTSVFSSLWGSGARHEVISNILYDLPGAGSELRFLPVVCLLSQYWLLMSRSGTYGSWYFSHLPLKDFAGCCERLSVPCPWVCILSTGHVTMCVGNFKCQRCSKTLTRENTLPSCSTCLLPASLPGGWAHLPCLLKLGICPSCTSSARIGEGSSWWWETTSLCMDWRAMSQAVPCFSVLLSKHFAKQKKWVREE